MAADEARVNEDQPVNGDAGGNDPGAGNAPVDANNRTFLITASLLTGTLLLLSLFTVGYLLLDRAGGRTAEIAAIETQNADILATNDMITRTVQAMEANATSRAGEITAATDAGETAAPEGEATGDAAAATPEPEAAATDAEATEADPAVAEATAVALAADPTLAAEATTTAAEAGESCLLYTSDAADE